MIPIVSSQKTVNGQPVPTKAPRGPRGRDLCDAAIRLRVYLGKELRKQAEEASLDAEHWGPSAVTALCISLERSGVRGIPVDADVDVV